MTYQDAMNYLSNTLSTPLCSELNELLTMRKWKEARAFFTELNLNVEVFDIIIKHEQNLQQVKVAFVETDESVLPIDSNGKKYLFRCGLRIFQSEIVKFKSYAGPVVYHGSQMINLEHIDQVWEIVHI